MKNIIFKEEQRFTQWWLWLILIITLIMPPLVNPNESSNYYLLISILLLALIYLTKLTTLVTKEGIHYRFFPFHFKEKIIKIEEIKTYEQIKYNPIFDYGGWGIRYGSNGKAYNVKGNIGVRILLKNGKKILFGTQDAHRFISAIKEANSSRE